MIKPAIKYKSLTRGASHQSAHVQGNQRIFGSLSKDLIDDLVEFCSGKNVLEAYAGRGHLSALLAEQGVAIKSTSLRQGHDGSEFLGHVFDVEELSVTEAVMKYGDWMDILIVCWPTTDTGMERVLPLLPKGVQIIFIGEITDYTCKPPFLGGCATDAFFEGVEEVEGFSLRYPTIRMDKLKVFKVKET